MSYVIPNNSKSSIILYLDSRDATSYLSTKLETDIDGNSREVNLNSYFQYVLTENIEVPLNQRALVSLQSATIPYSFYNIRSGVNDTLIYEITNVDTSSSTNGQTLTLTNGNYTAYTLADEIKTVINNHTIDVDYEFDMIYDSDKNKYLFSLTNKSNANQLRMDFFFANSIQSCNIEMGFEPLNHKFFSDTEESLRFSQNVIDINGSIHGVYIRSNLVSKGTLDSQNGTLSNILARLPINIQSGGIIFGDNNHHKSIVDLKYINTITIRLTDERNRLLDLNGLHFQLAIQIDFLYGKKPVLIPTGGLSESSGSSFHNEESEREIKKRLKKQSKINNQPKTK
tara:strand:+ start:123 stop:1145 length:1023 start_codon:yes stop_codon:yes gene_type:complete